MWTAPGIEAWESAGRYRKLAGHEVWTRVAGQGEPLLVLHGFPTCSYDYRGVLDRFAERYTVLLFDMLGYGLTAKPDIAYTLAMQADIAMAFVAELGIDRLAILSHDMGDTVGGELLARQAEGAWPVTITARVVTNGSIYIEMAHLTAGQQFLLSLPDARLESGVGAEGLAASLAETMSPSSTKARADLSPDAELICHKDGNLLLPRTIRYIEERRANQSRFTGAIETHASQVSVVWGTEDPIAVRDMASRLCDRRKDALLHWLDGIGHYPMLEAPAAFADVVLGALEHRSGS